MKNKTPIRAGILEARRTSASDLSDGKEATPQDDQVAYVVWERGDRTHLIDFVGGATGREEFRVNGHLVRTLLKKIREDEWGFSICAGIPGAWDHVVVDAEGMFEALKGLMPTPESVDGHCPVCGAGRIMYDTEDRTRWVCLSNCHSFFI